MAFDAVGAEITVRSWAFKVTPGFDSATGDAPLAPGAAAARPCAGPTCFHIATKSPPSRIGPSDEPGFIEPATFGADTSGKYTVGQLYRIR